MINDDNISECNETLRLTLQNNATQPDHSQINVTQTQAIVTIVDDDGLCIQGFNIMWLMYVLI